MAFMVCNCAPALAETSTVVAVEPTLRTALMVSTALISTACPLTS